MISKLAELLAYQMSQVPVWLGSDPRLDLQPQQSQKNISKKWIKKIVWSSSHSEFYSLRQRCGNTLQEDLEEAELQFGFVHFQKADESGLNDCHEPGRHVPSPSTGASEEEIHVHTGGSGLDWSGLDVKNQPPVLDPRAWTGPAPS